ncbi:MAG: peroxiredoxin family protein [Planctomycetota bacterium]
MSRAGFLPSFRFLLAVSALSVFTMLTGACTAQAPPDDVLDQRPKVGETAPDFKLTSLDDKQHQLSKITKDNPVVLLVLRGYPGYQCPICSRQVGDYISQAEAFAARGLKVIMVYPGPSEKLKERAEDFITGKTLPDNFHFLIDPDYIFTNAYSLRWDSKKETAYPATFVIQKASRKIAYTSVSNGYRGRTKAADILKLLDGLDE